MKNETQMYEAHAAFLVLSRAATEQAIKGHGLDEYLALQDHGTVLMADDLGLDIHAIRRAEAALNIAESLPIWKPR